MAIAEPTNAALWGLVAPEQAPAERMDQGSLSALGQAVQHARALLGASDDATDPSVEPSPIRLAAFIAARVVSALESAGYPRSDDVTEGWTLHDYVNTITVRHRGALMNWDPSLPERNSQARRALVCYAQTIRQATGLTVRIVSSEHWPEIQVKDDAGLAALEYRQDMMGARWLDLDSELTAWTEQRIRAIGWLAQVDQALDHAWAEKRQLLTAWAAVAEQAAALRRQAQCDTREEGIDHGDFRPEPI